MKERLARGTQRTTGLMVGYEVVKVSRLLSGKDLVRCTLSLKYFLFYMKYRDSVNICFAQLLLLTPSCHNNRLTEKNALLNSKFMLKDMKCMFIKLLYYTVIKYDLNSAIVPCTT